MLTFGAALALSWILAVEGQIISDGQCDTNVEPMSEFDLEGYLGLWYEISRTPNDFQAGECATASYTLNEETDQVEVYNSEVIENFYSSISGTARFEGDEDRGALLVNFPSVGSGESNYWVLDFHEDIYSLVYSCTNISPQQRSITMWKLSRTRTMAPNTHTYLNLLINLIDGISSDDMVGTDQSAVACSLLPELEAGAPVVLTGQCDENLPVMQNFDTEKYMGLWHDIASYANEFQHGTCSNARYTLTENGVDVLNSQVVSQGLDTISGTARLAGEDGSAKLIVTFPDGSGGVVESDYWILGTDYDNYALVYSCVNTDETQMRVWSWKLSRTKQISSESTNAINAIIRGIMSLNDRYYATTDQNDESCFYLPEPVLNQPVIFPGQCDELIPAMPNFDLERYSGLWHDIESYDSDFLQGTCSNAFYSVNPDNEVEVTNSQVVDQRRESISGIGRVTSEDGSAKMVVTFPVDGTEETIEANYLVLDTDYENYALVYSCRNINSDQRAVHSWKLSRNKQLSAEFRPIIDEKVEQISVLNHQYFRKRGQSDVECFYFPRAEAGRPVVFPGQCDENLAVVQDFDVGRYTGTWHDISSYPSVNRAGQCSNAQYTLGEGGVVEVINTQVSEGFLETITGTAVLDGSDGSAKLTVTFPPPPGSTEPLRSPYWVLATDYDNYALVYSCINMESDQRAVWSWKLSRTKEMSATSREAIDAAMAEVQEVDDQYFINQDQSDAACFFLPDLEPGVPVVIVGQCDPNIPVVQNFDPELFSGLWHDTASYYTEFQEGTCNDAFYTLREDNTFEVHNTQVIGQTLDTVTGTATLATADNSGKLFVSFPVAGTDGEVRTSEYWILNTDYESYALLYACENLNADSRQVWSWKMSRTRVVTDSANSEMDKIISAVQVLTNQFFMEKDQTDAGCFYFPEAVAGQPVTFRGHCDDSIPAVADFDADRYAGLWHEIEKYPSIFQGGTCNNAHYTLTSDGTVEVINTQVVNELLDSITGVATQHPDDTSGRLTVTFPIPGTDQFVDASYVVLATDYESYALVYSCENIDEYRRAVWSWKLSRSKQLNEQANADIMGAMEDIEVLDTRYFESTDQSAVACFYNPVPVPGEPVVFPGQCDSNVPVMEDFDLERYAGLWHNIASYPSTSQSGTCNRELYTPTSGGVAEVVNTQVLNQRLDTISGTLSPATDDGGRSGRFTVSRPVPGTDQTEELDYWVLDTDYEQYALVYSCFNINSEQRAVWSWQLSRTTSLTPAANDAIAEAIYDVQVLQVQYYDCIDQSDDGCFYLPHLEPNEPVIVVGQCDVNIPVVQNFDASRYLGLWHDIESYSSDFQDGTCHNARYTQNEDGTINIENTQVINQILHTVSGTAVSISDEGKLEVSITMPGNGETLTTELWVLDTDYDSYSFVYACENLDPERRRVWSWKLSRSWTLSSDAIVAIHNIMEDNQVLNEEYYIHRKQSDEDCFYYPEPVAGQPVTFRGQCDESIPAVADFDAVRYAGLWHDIEKYPSIFQGGTCNNAHYTLTSDGTVEVINTQVVNELLESITGVATQHPDDTSGRLTVTFPIPGTDQFVDASYVVLATDYESYALVYSCEKIDDYHRAVWSWKLSRSKQLNEQANADIMGAMEGIEVLDPRYFQPTDQSAVACFYNPVPVPGEPVVFPGQCDSNIPVMEDFDLERYAGLWHNIASYPSTSQSGTCNKELYTPTSGGVAEVVNTQVLNQRLDTISGTLSPATDDGGRSGRFTVSRPVPGTDQTEELDYWVLDTDYEQYALVYSCFNINSEQRAVWSWQLSRTTSLTPAANDAIAKAIYNVQVLQQQYFDRIDQSDNACFYLPHLEPNEPVIFVGQCDVNIPAVAEFDPVRYSGLWHEVESYHSVFQGGTCNNARYTPSADGTVEVLNTQVVAERLDTVSGVARIVSEDQSGKLEVEFPVAGSDETVLANYWVLTTDYESYALVYSCANLDGQRRQVWSWKLSRTKQLSPSSIAAIDAVVQRVSVLAQEYFNDRDQTNEGCFYYPFHVAGQPVVFPGQCDESVQVVQPFDLEQYLGFWYDVESYPQPFQAGGTCANAMYSANEEDGTVAVLNTHVLEQRLQTISGVATPAGEDGEAKLIVSFPIPGSDLMTNSPYWVLSTDYTDYALVYSCTNIDDGWRSVTSWKLSREPTLSAESTAAIDRAVSEVQVLSEDYYEERGQTAEACFYYPDNEGGPVILDGQCDDEEDVPALENFSFIAYMGDWYEAARFPSEMQTGQCARERYQAGSALHTIVSEESLRSAEGQVDVSADGRAAFTVTFQSQDGAPPVSIRYYVLATDYNSYSLVFSCRNLDDNLRKQVYSWKLSRFREGLSADANERIDEAVTSYVDLFEDYYGDSDQSDAACFYYPELSEPDAIVLPGPCNETIAPMAGLQTDRYLVGRWFEFARYPQELQVGECARTEYSQDGGVLEVVNTIVSGEELDEEVGTVTVENDGRLRVTYTAGSETRETHYYVLTTDYDNYALLYSCNDLPNGYRQVTSWKLGRQSTWNPAYDVAMDPVIKETQGLLENYYVTTAQTDNACFYIPELDESEPLVYRGQCEDIQGMADFDAQSYMGWWHEIRHFPAGFETGDCLSSQYQFSNGQYSNLNTSVNGLEATVVSNNLVIAANAPGRLRKTLDNGQVVDILVLATDYETYSLLYSCENVDDESRRVWSAMHSKTRELTQDAEEAMGPRIEENQVLQPQFYLPVDQTDEGCFHYPALSPGELVIMPGQCDESIPVVQNFDFASYSGVWHHIQRYPHETETGSCTGVRYTLNEETGELNVISSDLVDGEQVVREGTAVGSADGSGRFTVTYPGENSEETQTTVLHVLATNYNTYALVYSCSNYNGFQRTVGSWKLGREPELSAADNAAITSAMASHQVLHQPYFVDVEHNEDCPTVPGAAIALKAVALMVALAVALLNVL